MNTFLWNETLTDLALKNQTHESWAVVNPSDMLKAIQLISKSPQGFPESQKELLRREIGTKGMDFLNRLINFGFLVEGHDAKGEPVYQFSTVPQSPGTFTGDYLARLVDRDGIQSQDALHAIGHNFILGARESLEFCSALHKPGLPRHALKDRFEDHLVFNNKLNQHKFQNLLEYLQKLAILVEDGGIFSVIFSPAPLTFYCMAERYLLEADYRVGERVHAGDLLSYLDTVLPAPNERTMSVDTLGLSRFPLEGWGKYTTWMPATSFTELLKLGLIHPLSVARVLRVRAADQDAEDAHVARQALAQLHEKLVKDSHVWEKPLHGLEEWLSIFPISNDTISEDHQTLDI